VICGRAAANRHAGANFQFAINQLITGTAGQLRRAEGEDGHNYRQQRIVCGLPSSAQLHRKSASSSVIVVLRWKKSE
jgi:hypothetical protein